METKLDILVIAAHPDDAELMCSGTIAKHVAQGHKVGVLDLTRGELGTRGTIHTRREEAENSAKILGLSVRENAEFEDGFFVNDKQHQLELIKFIRKFQPDMVICNPNEDRHPDHGRAAKLVIDSCFLSGLRKVETIDRGVEQKEWRPKHIYQFIQNDYIQPDFVVDITEYWELKLASIRAFSTQFFTGGNDLEDEPETFISNPGFMEFIEARAKEYGHQIGVKYGEGFTTVKRTIGVDLLTDLI
ncbi:bacillithiol biosynthesis deacetylase BshB1 [Aureibacter tunicatorum]|uniref:Bacillithiol biosynthesis deacetylase BshB1 n=1 Tax=Aureibacter tunicatorum TaxID=866807 RepID=A0AAE3XRF9_9BACT|nr:bacillithiol biosynthesis deacetylase BshB1 [Aureibacter tunicatorum]MDR6241310.1 bacillithiol biosynthesis deacetylase BshB1 [Aureibacter tunicatorum]BDD03569.1 bacillithiol biosynthesis deacetylase BshB1 [Aureibacter tunicatorum]